MSNSGENPTGRCFLPPQADDQPADLFENISATIEPNQPVRFARKTDVHEVLMFISGVCKTGGAAPDRAVYAYVWGPHVNGQEKDNHGVNDLDRTLDPQTAERAQLYAAIEALALAIRLRVKYERLFGLGKMPPSELKFWDPRRLVIAFDGDYFLDHVARSTYALEKNKGRDNLDLKQQVEAGIATLKRNDITVQFWHLDESNLAEDYANARLIGK